MISVGILLPPGRGGSSWSRTSGVPAPGYNTTVIMVWFLPRDASAERGDATVSRLSVCLSVRL